MQKQTSSLTSAAGRIDPSPFDLGLFAFRTKVFRWMAAGLLISAVCAFVAAEVGPVARALFTPFGLTPLGWIVTLSPLALVLVLSGFARRLSAAAASICFLIYAILVGLSLGGLAAAYTGGQITLAFVAAAAGFAGLSVYGAVTRTDLGGLRTLLVMGLVGLIAAMVFLWVFPIPGLDAVVSLAGLTLFSVLTAYDVQRLADLYAQVGDEDGAPAIVGALSLYLDFLNIALLALRFFGRRR